MHQLEIVKYRNEKGENLISHIVQRLANYLTAQSKKIKKLKASSKKMSQLDNREKKCKYR